MSDQLPAPGVAVTEPELPPASEPDPAADAAPPPRRGGWGWLWLILLLAAGGAVAWFAWQAQRQQLRAEGWEAAVAGLREELRQVRRSLDEQARSERSLATRIGDASARQQVLREELLGLSERAGSLEEAVARLADARLRGEALLTLNEVEFLLLLGEERQRLFGDRRATLEAFALADQALTSLDDPAFSILRETLAGEIRALRDAPEDPTLRMRAGLAGLAAALDGLSEADDAAIATDAASAERPVLLRALDRLITVRRLDHDGTSLDPVRQAALDAAIRLQLVLAQYGFERGDAAGYRHALDEARVLFERRHGREAPRVQAWLAELGALRALQPSAAAALGATLRELRGMRATRSLAAPAAPTEPAEPAAAVPDEDAAEAPVHAEPDDEDGPGDQDSQDDEAGG